MSDDAWPTTNLSLLLRCKDPKADHAWSDFVSRYRPSMLRLIRDVFRVQDAEAEDIAQDVLLNLAVTTSANLFTASGIESSIILTRESPDA